MEMYYFYFALAIFSILFVRFLNIQDPAPIVGVYRKPGKWYYLKFALFYSLLQFRKLMNKIKKDEYTSNQTGYGVKSRNSPEAMDCAQTLSDDPQAIDAVYFNAASKDGYYLVGGTARRPEGVINGFLYLKVPAVGLLLTPKLPDTTLFQSEHERENNVFGAEGLRFHPLEPMKRWRLTYNGKMKLFTDPEKTFEVCLDAEWKSELPYFDFDTDMDPVPVARSFATEVWSREYFDTLKEAHQTHYEQHGDIRGTATIDGKAFPIHLNSMRDHSYGHKREWKNFHRYALHMATLEDGTRFGLGIVSSPISFSSIELGYLYTPDGKLHALRSCDLKLYEHGENGTPPLDYGFNFRTGSHEYRVQVRVEDSPEFYIGWEWEARVVERLARYTVNGIKGWGIAEWEYRHVEGRPTTITTATVAQGTATSS